jgi:hypothetical protein
MTGHLTAGALLILAGASFAKNNTSHTVGTFLYWIASWLFVVSMYALRRTAWRNRRAVLPPPFDVGGRCPASKWTTCAAIVAIPGAMFSLLALGLHYFTSSGSFGEDVRHVLTFVGLAQQITIIFQLLFVASLWPEIVATGTAAAAYSYTRSPDIVHRSSTTITSNIDGNLPRNTPKNRSKRQNHENRSFLSKNQGGGSSSGSESDEERGGHRREDKARKKKPKRNTRRARKAPRESGE